MSKFIAKVNDIKSCDNLHIVEFICGTQTLNMMSLELLSEITIGTKVTLCAKPSNIAIAKNIQGELSYSNQIKAKIVLCEIGKLLTSVEVLFDDIKLESIITSTSALRMDLKTNDDVVILIKASELSIKEICND